MGDAVRQLHEHEVNPANASIKIEVMDEPGAGGACHEYEVSWGSIELGQSIRISFQNGPIPQNGVNGLTHEVLLAIIADRLRSFQVGPYACEENYQALNHIIEAQMWLQRRTLARIARGVEGTHEV